MTTGKTKALAIRTFVGRQINKYLKKTVPYKRENILNRLELHLARNGHETQEKVLNIINPQRNAKGITILFCTCGLDKI